MYKLSNNPRKEQALHTLDGSLVIPDHHKNLSELRKATHDAIENFFASIPPQMQSEHCNVGKLTIRHWRNRVDQSIEVACSGDLSFRHVGMNTSKPASRD